ncbi:LapA family protein [Paragemmobacter kunshanensis]|uniref:LapA family protein n=1 Tax=Paragemmobacter kunshanensis TaxID=2583234 RepID=UPI001F4A0444|nr:LapA family protein [Rhodobacter kunshanensis]
MLRTLRYALIAVLLLVLLTMALANRTVVPVRFLPEDVGALLGLSWQMELPLFLVILGGVAAGVLIGFTWEWLREHKHRKTASQRGRDLARLERELEVMRDSRSVPGDDVLALIEKRKAG